MNTKFISSGILLIATMLVSSCSKSHSHNYEDAEETVDVAFPETDSVTLTNTYPDISLLRPKSMSWVVQRTVA